MVGTQLIKLLIENDEFSEIVSLVRRENGFNHVKLKEHIIDFDQSENWSNLVKGDVLFSTLGTTIKKAKTRENQYLVDFTYQYEFAKAAAGNGVSAYVLVSSMGASSKSSVFYSRIKGGLEDAVSSLNFRKLIIFRPSILDGNRQEKRAGEKMGLVVSRFLTKFVLKNYKSTPVDVLASKMIRLSLDQTAGFRMIEGAEIFSV